MSSFERGLAVTGECQLQNSLAPHPRRRTPVKRNKRIFVSSLTMITISECASVAGTITSMELFD